YEVVLKIGSDKPHPGGPKDPTRPIGTIPAVWTYSYGYVQAPRGRANEFVPGLPPYNPWVQRPPGVNEYWAELDFPEFGKAGDFDKALYNTFCQTRHHPELFDVRPAIDGRYHTLTTDWRTELRPIPNVTDAQVVEQGGYHWVNDKSVPFDAYLGNPLKRLGKDRYAVYAGKEANHWLDGKPVARNVKYVPSMAGQLNVGVWLPDWAGPAPWHTAEVRIASVKIWQYNDDGDVRGVLTKDIPDNFGKDGKAIK
ncbi:MAG TPA: hypothetical protein VEA69_12710, partial [Tepidisphaeraceae bacterium]|nr:hypothetical protein [Tepidisphaeraceae bacterium]